MYEGGNLLIIIGILIASEISKIPRQPQKGGAYAEIGLLLLLVAIIVAVVLIIKHGVAEKKKKDAGKKKKDADKKKKDAGKKKKHKNNNKKHHPPSHPEIKCLTTDIWGPQKKPDGVVNVDDLLKLLGSYGKPCKQLRKAKTEAETRSKLFHCLAKHQPSQSSKSSTVRVEDLLKVLEDWNKKSNCD